MIKRLLRPLPKFIKDWLNLWLLLICYAGWQNDPSNLWRLFFIAGGVVNAYALIVRRRGGKTYARKRWAEMAYSASRFKIISPDGPNGPPEAEFKFKYAPLPDEYIFRPGHRKELRIPVEVYENLMLRFLKKAQRRQVYALHQNKAKLWSGHESYRPIRSNAILSEKEFTERTRPRFFDDEYFAIMTILAHSGIVIGGTKGQGKSGRLRGDYSPAYYLEIAIRRWGLLTAPPTPHPGFLARGRKLFS